MAQDSSTNIETYLFRMIQNMIPEEMNSPSSSTPPPPVRPRRRNAFVYNLPARQPATEPLEPNINVSMPESASSLHDNDIIPSLYTLREIMAEYSNNMRHYHEVTRESIQLIRELQNRSRQETIRQPRHISPVFLTRIFADDPMITNNTDEFINQQLNIFPFEVSSDGETQCPITLEYFQQGDSIGQFITCGHMFRETAIRNWLRRHNLCPVCRQDIRRPSTTTNNVTELIEEIFTRMDR